jgi:peptidoglycan/xylan/chitin deacetylase (PgdA/CDA1 family)
VNFHYIRPAFTEPYPGIHGVTPAALEAQLRELGRLGEFVSGEQILSATGGGRPLPERALLVTFDDGLREQFDHALPVLQRLSVPALFFVNTGPILDGTVSFVHKVHLLRSRMPPEAFVGMLRTEALRLGVILPGEEATAPAAAQYPYDPPASAQVKYFLNFVLPQPERERLIAHCFAEAFGARERELSEALYLEPAQIRLLGSGMVGTHGHQHLPLGLLDRDAVRSSLQASMDCLRRWTGRAPFALSYPYGSREACAPWVARLAEGAGLAFGFTMERAVNVDLERPLELARFDCNDVPGGSSPVAADRLFRAEAARRWHLDAPLALQEA